MLLWLQRAWSSYLRAAVIRAVKRVDVNKTPARIFFPGRRGARGQETFTSPLIRENPIEQTLFGEIFQIRFNMNVTCLHLAKTIQKHQIIRNPHFSNIRTFQKLDIKNQTQF